ncbi:MAG: hypothetical protein OXD37_09460 [Acidimicrobiaceae bacterium]|nr:hypothetical protein [Acidimicrobiaceae bacterium]
MSIAAILGAAGSTAGLLLVAVGLWLPTRDPARRRSGSRLRDLLPTFSSGDEANLRLAGITPELYGLQRVLGMLGGLAVGVPLGLVWRGPGLGALVVAALLATTGWVLPMLGMRDAANRARAEFDTVTRVWIALVALQVRAGATASEAMMQAARVGRRPAWVLLYRHLLAAQQQRRPAWEGLSDIVERYDMRSLAPAVAALGLAAQRGTRVSDAVLAAADTLWRDSLSRDRERTLRRAQLVVLPATLVALGLAALLVYPPFSALTSGGLVEGL